MTRESSNDFKERKIGGISKEVTCMLCRVDRIENIYTRLICDGRPKYNDIDRELPEVVEENFILYL